MTSVSIDRRDGLSAATAYKGPCRVATISNITLAGEQTIDNLAVVAGDRVLVKDQADARFNGVYIVDTGDWSRAKDFSRNDDVFKGTRVAVTDGSSTAGGTWQVSADDINLGVEDMAFIQVEQLTLADIALLPLASPLTGAENFPVTQNFGAKRSTISAVWTYIKGLITGSSLSTAGVSTLVGVDASNNIVRSALHYANVKDHGAAGNGVANDTVAIAAAIATGKWVIFPAGTYLTDQVTVSAKRKIVVAEGAIVKLRSGSSSSIGVFNFTSGAAGSYIGGGGTIDGNRDALFSFYSQLSRTYVRNGTTYTIEVQWDGIRAIGCAALHIEDLTIQNTMTCAVTYRDADRVYCNNIRAINVGKIQNFQNINNGYCGNWYIENAGNRIANGTPIPYWQHGVENYELRGCIFENFQVNGFHPKIEDAVGDTIGDPLPIVFAFTRVEDSIFRGMHAGSYTYDPLDSSDINAAFVSSVSTQKNCVFENFTGKDYYFGVEFHSCDGGRFTDSVLENMNGNVASGGGHADSIGVHTLSAGIYPLVGNVDTNTNANATGRDFVIDRIATYGFTFGMWIFSSKIIISNSKITAAWVDGIHIAQEADNSGTFPAASAMPISNITVRGCDIQANGYSGIGYVNGNHVVVDSCVIANNGQRIGSDVYSLGIRSGPEGAGNPRSFFTVKDCTIYDNQSWTLTDNATFNPGSSDSHNQFQIYCYDTRRVGLGQKVTFVNATGSGDISGWVTDKTLDLVTITTAAPVTFSSTGNLDALTGTWSITAGQNTLTGSGGAANSEIKGLTWIKIGSEYLLVTRVFGNNSMQVSGSAATTHTAASASMVRVNMSGVPCQRIPMDVASNIDHVAWSGLTMSGHTVTTSAYYPNSPYVFGIDSLVDGQEFITQYVASISTAGSETRLTPAVLTDSQNLSCQEISFIVTADVTGTDGTISLGTGVASNFVAAKTGLALTKNTKWSGKVSTQGSHTDSALWVIVKLQGGADNTPSGGSFKAICKLKRLDTPIIADVP